MAQAQAVQRVLMLDNYDSFTFNIVQYLGELDAEVMTYRNDEITLEQMRGHFASGHRAFCGQTAYFGRLPGASGHRPGVRRQSGAGTPGDAR